MTHLGIWSRPTWSVSFKCLQAFHLLPRPVSVGEGASAFRLEFKDYPYLQSTPWMGIHTLERPQDAQLIFLFACLPRQNLPWVTKVDWIINKLNGGVSEGMKLRGDPHQYKSMFSKTHCLLSPRDWAHTSKNTSLGVWLRTGSQSFLTSKGGRPWRTPGLWMKEESTLHINPSYTTKFLNNEVSSVYLCRLLHNKRKEGFHGWYSKRIVLGKF